MKGETGGGPTVGTTIGGFGAPGGGSNEYRGPNCWNNEGLNPCWAKAGAIVSAVDAAIAKTNLFGFIYLPSLFLGERDIVSDRPGTGDQSNPSPVSTERVGEDAIRSAETKIS
jgi:hypothetical protein